MPGLTPSEFAGQYNYLYAKAPEGPYLGPIAVNKYRMKGYNTSKAKEKKDDVIGALRWRYKQIMGKTQSGDDIVIPNEKKGSWYPNLPLVVNKVSIVRAFYGKGSPEEMQLALYATLATKNVSANTEAIQKMADTCMGLDCNGFVGNYMRRIGWMNADGHYGPSTPTTRYAQRGLIRNSPSEVMPGDVFIWDDPRHIAIAQCCTLPGYYIRVVESAASLGGLDSRWYQFTGKTKTGATGVDGRGEGTMLQVIRPNGKGGSYTKYLLVCKVQ